MKEDVRSLDYSSYKGFVFWVSGLGVERLRLVLWSWGLKSLEF